MPTTSKSRALVGATLEIAVVAARRDLAGSSCRTRPGARRVALGQGEARGRDVADCDLVVRTRRSARGTARSACSATGVAIEDLGSHERHLRGERSRARGVGAGRDGDLHRALDARRHCRRGARRDGAAARRAAAGDRGRLDRHAPARRPGAAARPPRASRARGWRERDGQGAHRPGAAPGRPSPRPPVRRHQRHGAAPRARRE